MKPIWAVIPGRMASSRLPGKTMADLAGRPSLRRIIDRLTEARLLDGVMVATTTEPADDAIRECAGHAGVPCYSGSAEDVLERTLLAARSVGAESIVTVGGDSPFADPEVVDRVVEAGVAARADYASNNLFARTYPVGLDVEICTTESLARVETLAPDPRYREHVTLYYHEHPDDFRLVAVTAEDRHRRPDLRLTLDTREDLELAQAVYTHFSPRRFSLGDVLSFLESRPELAAINRHVAQVVP